MRTLTCFELISDDADDIAGIAVTINEVRSQFAYPACATEDDPEAEMLIECVASAYAAHNVEFIGEDAKEWFDGWLLVDAYLLDNRVAPPASVPEVVEEMTVDLGDNGTTEIATVELSGDLSGESASELTEGGAEKITEKKSRKVKKRAEKLREGAGCKQPDKVNGFMAGRLLCVTKNHRRTGDRAWGRCEYRVRCNDDGSYTLEHFAGNRTDVKQGDNWQTASIMFKVLLGLPPETMHHRMTIKRWFNL